MKYVPFIRSDEYGCEYFEETGNLTPALQSVRRVIRQVKQYNDGVVRWVGVQVSSDAKGQGGEGPPEEEN